jgi:hypothetical protein
MCQQLAIFRRSLDPYSNYQTIKKRKRIGRREMKKLYKTISEMQMLPDIE